jgi:hypothetical protein
MYRLTKLIAYDKLGREFRSTRLKPPDDGPHSPASKVILLFIECELS